MASTKAVQHIVSLLELRDRCPVSAITKFLQFLQDRDGYLNRLQQLEDSGARGRLPAIDWDFYKRNVRSDAVSLVEDFEKKYTSLTVPFPVDKYTAKIERLKDEIREEIIEFVQQSNARIEAYQKEIIVVKERLPFNQMSWEEYIDAYPKEGPNFIKKPTFWPHDPPEQLGYVEEEPEQEHAGDAGADILKSPEDSKEIKKDSNEPKKEPEKEPKKEPKKE